MVLLGFDVLVGAAIGFIGYHELGSDAVALAGMVLATIGLADHHLFREAIIPVEANWKLMYDTFLRQPRYTSMGVLWPF